MDPQLPHEVFLMALYPDLQDAEKCQITQHWPMIEQGVKAVDSDMTSWECLHRLYTLLRLGRMKCILAYTIVNQQVLAQAMALLVIESDWAGVRKQMSIWLLLGIRQMSDAQWASAFEKLQRLAIGEGCEVMQSVTDAPLAMRLGERFGWNTNKRVVTCLLGKGQS
jgi:hypothetical protein